MGVIKLGLIRFAPLHSLASQVYSPRALGETRRTLRRGGRVAEGARLESVYTGNRIGGSNPPPSAIFTLNINKNKL